MGAVKDFVVKEGMRPLLGADGARLGDLIFVRYMKHFDHAIFSFKAGG